MTSIDRMIPNFSSLDQALAQTSADGRGGRRRADVLGGNELGAWPSMA